MPGISSKRYGKRRRRRKRRRKLKLLNEKEPGGIGLKIVRRKKEA
ncbi:MAG: hypothetical protein O8C56_07550 [Candidatus Methanoperedens sp.]|nr:hypothetical protein [Candidatus Methanoperedens sp.]